MANSMGESQNKTVEIVSFDRCDKTVKSMFCPEVLEDILRQNSCPEGYLVISVIGPIRTGKSFLINILACYLQHLSKYPDLSAEEWLHSEIKIEGVEWMRANESVTSGIWVWNEPFVVQKDNKKFGVLLMDCQGLNDADNIQAEVTDTLITLFALELSNVHIVNVKENLGSNDLRNLETTMEFAGIRRSWQTETHLKELVILHRDWEHDDDLGQRPSMFCDGSEPLTPGRQKIKEAFSGHMEYKLPIPGKPIRKGSSKDGVWIHELMRDEENKVFLEITTDFCQQLVRKLPHGQLKLVEGSQLMENISGLRNSYGDGRNNPRFSSVTEIGKYTAMRDVVKELKQEIRQAGIPITGYENEEEIERHTSEKYTMFTDRLKNKLTALGYALESDLVPDLLNNIKKELLETVQEEKQKAKRELKKQKGEREKKEEEERERKEEIERRERREDIKTVAMVVGAAGALAAGGAMAVEALAAGGTPDAATTETAAAAVAAAAADITGKVVITQGISTGVKAASFGVFMAAGTAAAAAATTGSADVTGSAATTGSADVTGAGATGDVAAETDVATVTAGPAAAGPPATDTYGVTTRASAATAGAPIAE